MNFFVKHSNKTKGASSESLQPASSETNTLSSEIRLFKQNQPPLHPQHRHLQRPNQNQHQKTTQQQQPNQLQQFKLCLTQQQRLNQPAAATHPLRPAASLGTCCSREDSGLGIDLQIEQQMQQQTLLQNPHRRPCRGLAFTVVFAYSPSPTSPDELALSAEEKVLAIDCSERRPDWLQVRRLSDGVEGFAPTAFLLCDADGRPAFQRCLDSGCCQKKRSPPPPPPPPSLRSCGQLTRASSGGANQFIAAEECDAYNGNGNGACGLQLSQSIRWTAF